MNVVAIANQKGGVGKTATARMISSLLAEQGKRVLAIDLDQQFNLTTQVGASPSEHNSCSVMREGNIRDAIQRLDTFDIIPGATSLCTIDAEFATAFDRDWRLKSAIEDGNLEELYDYIIFDLPPALGIIVLNALVAADYVVIPTNPDADGIRGVINLGEVAMNIRKRSNPNLKFAGILMTLFQKREINSKITRELAQKAAERLGTIVFENEIRPAVAMREAKIQFADLACAKPNSPVVQDYRNFVSELLEILSGT